MLKSILSDPKVIALLSASCGGLFGWLFGAARGAARGVVSVRVDEAKTELRDAIEAEDLAAATPESDDDAAALQRRFAAERRLRAQRELLAALDGIPA